MLYTQNEFVFENLLFQGVTAKNKFHNYFYPLNYKNFTKFFTQCIKSVKSNKYTKNQLSTVVLSENILGTSSIDLKIPVWRKSTLKFYLWRHGCILVVSNMKWPGAMQYATLRL